MVALAGDDIGDQRLPAVLRAAVAVTAEFRLCGFRRGFPQRGERRVEVDLTVAVKRLDRAKARLGLPVPAAGPADRVTNGFVRRIAADEARGEVARLLQLGQVAASCRLGEPPV